ncbi:MAG TPA: hypothetical protein VGX25_09765 [Actinophytocola sp.]|uniref:hypothetical protein n=1 Tax=Actinophytocola sp. TaxID=1872138 RepID=UPI002DDD4FF5|nr:hypothetical protein [Actinophytocola sp.]HEV2779674.1 hypothetical protein [Actinophytocola sp.]
MAHNGGGDDELFLMTMLRNPIKAADAVVRTGIAMVPAALEALRAIPRIAAAMEKLVPAMQAAQSSLDRIDRLGIFVAQEMPETQHQLEEVRKQLLAVMGKQRPVAAVNGKRRHVGSPPQRRRSGSGHEAAGGRVGRPRGSDRRT